ncbi:MAG: TadE family protein [Candidatus Sulfotelmatobacter sp.]
MVITRMKSLWTKLRNVASGTSGQEIVESAFVLPLIFMFVIGIIWFGLAFFIYGTLTQGARAGAEAAVAPVCTTCAAGSTPATIAQTAVYNALGAGHLSKSQLVPTSSWAPPVLCLCGSVSSRAACTTALACDNSVTDVCVQVNVQLSYSSQGGAGTCGTSVSARYKYPFHFSIPLTNLDIGNVLLPGQAQMRAETQ